MTIHLKYYRANVNSFDSKSHGAKRVKRSRVVFWTLSLRVIYNQFMIHFLFNWFNCRILQGILYCLDLNLYLTTRGFEFNKGSRVLTGTTGIIVVTVQIFNLFSSLESPLSTSRWNCHSDSVLYSINKFDCCEI